MRFIFIVCLIALQVEAAEFFVSTSGNNANPGTIGSPWRDISYAATHISAGDTISVRGGTYTSGTGNETNPIDNPPGGSPGNYTTIQNYNGETVIILVANGADFVFFNASAPYTIYSGLRMNMTNSPLASGAVIKLTENANHCIITNCFTDACGDGHGVLNSPGNADNADNLLIINSRSIYNGWNWQGGTADHDYYMECRNTIIDGCLIGFAQDHGIHRFSGVQGGGDIYRNNTLVGNQHGIGIYSTTNHTVYNNIGYSNIVAFVNGFESGSIRFINNTAYKNTLNFLVQENVTGWTLLQNNISANGGGGVNPGIEIDGSGQIVTNINNLSCDNGGGGNYVNNNGANTITANNLFGDQYDAAFADAANTNFTTLSTSSARNAGAPHASVTTDIIGTSRPQESVYDIGAYEYNAGGQLPLVTVNATDAVATEGPLTTGTFTFSRTGSTASPLTVLFSVSGTAGSGVDYTSLGTSIVIPAGQSTVDTNVVVIQDSAVEPDETVIATISADAAYTVGSPSSATVTIISDDILVDPRSVPAPGNTFPLGDYITNRFNAMEVQLVSLRKELTNTNAQLLWISNKLARMR